MADNVVRVQVTGGSSAGSSGSAPSLTSGSSPATAARTVAQASGTGGTAPAASQGGSALGLVAGGGAIAAGIAAAAVAVFEKVKSDFLSRAQELSAYSPQIALAESQTSIRTMQADFREANELGPALARLVTAQNEADIQFREIMLPIKKAMLEVVVNVMETLADWLKEARVFMAEAAEVFRLLGSIRNLDTFWEALAQIPGRLKEIRDEMRKRISEEATETPSWMEDFLSIGQGGQPPNVGGNGGGEGGIGAAFRATRRQKAKFVGPPTPIGLGNGMGFVGII